MSGRIKLVSSIQKFMCSNCSQFVLFHPFLIGLKVSTVDILPAGYLSSIRCQRAYGSIDSLQGVLFEFDDQNVSNQTIWNSTCRFMYRYTNTISPIAAEDIRRGF